MKRTKLFSVSSWLPPMLALVAVAMPARAQDDDHVDGVIEPSIFVFVEEDPHDSAKFLQYRDVPDGLVVDHFNITWEEVKELFGGGLFVELDAVDPVQDDQRLRLQFGERARWKGTLSFYENPRRFGDNPRSLYTYQGDGVFTLDDVLQAAVQAAPASADMDADLEWDPGTKGALIRDAIAESADEITLEYQRKTGEAEFAFTPNRSAKFGFNAKREKRSGTKPQPLGQIFNMAPVEVAAPVDYTTDWLTLFGEVQRKKWVLGANLNFSSFDTGQDTLTWDNQLALNDTAVSGTAFLPGSSRFSLGTDNDWRQWQVYFGGNLPGHTRINASISQARTTQDDPFLPFTSNSLIVAPELPAESLDGEYENNAYDLRINSRPIDWFRVKGWWRHYEQDNETPSYVFDSYVETDYQLADARRNLPYSYDKTNYGALVGFEPADWAEISLSWERVGLDREHSAVESSDEDTWKLALDFDVNEHLFLRAAYWLSDREADHYDVHYFEESFPEGESVVAPVNPGSRRFYWTDRDREAYSLLAEITASSKVTVYAEALHSENDYFDPETGQKVGTSFELSEDRNGDGTDELYEILLAGRISDDTTSYTLGLSLTPNENWSIFIDHTWEDVEWHMASRYRGVTGGIATDNPLDNWFSDVDDDYRTWSLGFNGKIADGLWEVYGDWTYTRAHGNILTDVVEGGAASGNTSLTEFPELRNTFHVAYLGFERHVEDAWDLGMRFWWETWDDRNFTTDYHDPYMGNPTQDRSMDRAVFLGLDYADYDVLALAFYARYRF